MFCWDWQEYGMTETTGCVSSLAAGDEAHAASSGLLLPCWEAMVVDLATKQPLALRETGELWVRGPSVMKGDWIKEYLFLYLKFSF